MADILRYVAQGLSCLLASLFLLCSLSLHAEAPLLPPEQAFQFSVESVNPQQAELRWNMPEQYYLYQHQFKVEHGQQILALELPPAEDVYDENYGHTQVYYQQVSFKIPTQAAQRYQVSWQGCAQDRLCYPPQRIEFQTDSTGLVILDNQSAAQKNLWGGHSNPTQNVFSTTQTNSTLASSTSPAAAQTITAQDQIWSEKLAQSSFAYGLLLFLGLGVLLAFTPCSLPMLPILTSLLVREHKGVKAWTIALVFVCSMAIVYAILGLIASSAGLNFQRWLQQPATLIAFSLLFVLFALNLFGLFEIKLPRAWVNRLDQAQSMQKGGNLAGAALMGMLSALLVGPCMTAPLAGALLFISQTQSQMQGALLLFTLGFGMGTPLLLASVLGAKALPRAGLWMHQVKVLFAFIMLALALYFIRPLLGEAWMQWLSLALGVGFVGYVLHRLSGYHGTLRAIYLSALLVVVPYLIYNQYQHSQRFWQQENDAVLEWHRATTATELQQLLAQAPKNQRIIIDVYADWCVACRPIEQQVLTSSTVKQALAEFYLIKLDLSHYDASHQALLNQWEILGPPTFLFLDAQQQEIRSLRLTGAFNESTLLNQLQQLQTTQESSS
ncbi:protein-disulfide reductase DsbD [Acinetobacter sp. YH16058]|uniref:protein-disulfide reductase DsbD n=1 Tax=Acinetobacter sp. YH16058 TaxID=2601196 RepID=UPI0015D3B6C2|nr:protein-disulfide reductase DsbD [Acinetobacter sp. YH16058]